METPNTQNHPPKGYLLVFTDGRMCMADGKGGLDQINVPQLLAEREQLRAEVENLKTQRGRAITAAQRLRSCRPSAKKFKAAEAELEALEKEVEG